MINNNVMHIKDLFSCLTIIILKDKIYIFVVRR